jgi:(p)ppGpp synthase/HD superfamily hydrolase
MRAYAQTNVQLFNQLRSAGYSQKERQFLRQVYTLATRLFTGLFLPSGKTFLDHLVGTASILASLHSPVEIVAAGLVHAAYLHGDFGSIKKGISKAKRAQLRRIVGDEVEEYVAKYDRLLWTWQNVQKVHANLADIHGIDRQVLLIRLANELEHQLDLGGIYYAESEKEQRKHQINMTGYGPMLIDMAERLGFFSLAVEMRPVFDNTVSAQLPIVPWIRSKHQVAYLLAPKSYHERFLVMLWRKVSESYQFCSRIHNRVNLVCRKIAKRIRRFLRTLVLPTSQE